MRQCLTRRGFANHELLTVLALAIIVLLGVLPGAVRAYHFIVDGWVKAGETIGWLQHLQAGGLGLLLAVVAMSLAVGALGLGISGLVWAGERFQDAVADLKCHWSDPG